MARSQSSLPAAGHGAGHPEHLATGRGFPAPEKAAAYTGHLQSRERCLLLTALGGQGGVRQDTLAAALILTQEEQKMGRD